MRLSQRLIHEGARPLPHALAGSSIRFPRSTVLPRAPPPGGKRRHRRRDSTDPVRAPATASDQPPARRDTPHYGAWKSNGAAAGPDAGHHHSTRFPGVSTSAPGCQGRAIEPRPFLDRKPAPETRRGRQQELQRRTGATRIALVGNSRGGAIPIRNYISKKWWRGRYQPCRAVRRSQPLASIEWDEGLGGEFNGRGRVLRGFERRRERGGTPGTAFLTLAQRRHR